MLPKIRFFEQGMRLDLYKPMGLVGINSEHRARHFPSSGPNRYASRILPFYPLESLDGPLDIASNRLAGYGKRRVHHDELPATSLLGVLANCFSVESDESQKMPANYDNFSSSE